MTMSSAPSVSPAPPEQLQPRRLVRRIRLSTFLLLMVAVALLVGLYDQRRRQALLLDRLSLYRNLGGEGIYDALKLPGGSLIYLDGATLDVVLKKIKVLTTKNPKAPKLTAGMPFFVDPIGLQEAGVSMGSRVKRPPSADSLTLGEHLARILDPLGLAYQVKDGYVMITSKESLDVPLREDETDLFLKYRDVLD